MSDTAIDRWREIVGGAFSFQLDAFQKIATLPYGIWLALAIVLLSGLSLAIAQSIILFISRVRPTRFAFSLLLNAVLFAIGFIFLTLSTWIICLLPWSVRVPLPTLIATFGLGYAPLLFSFLGALPYLGYPIGNLLSVWNLLALVVGFAAVAQIEASSAFVYVALGWLVKQLVEGTIGQPIARVGRILADRVAGVDLADTPQEFSEQILAGVRPAEPIIAASQTRLPEVRQLIQVSGRSAPEAARTVAQTLTTQPIASTALNITQQIDTSNPLVQFDHQTREIPQPLKLALSLLVMAIVFVIGSVAGIALGIDGSCGVDLHELPHSLPFPVRAVNVVLGKALRCALGTMAGHFDLTRCGTEFVSCARLSPSEVGASCHACP